MEKIAVLLMILFVSSGFASNKKFECKKIDSKTTEVKHFDQATFALVSYDPVLNEFNVTTVEGEEYLSMSLLSSHYKTEYLGENDIGPGIHDNGHAADILGVPFPRNYNFYGYDNNSIYFELNGNYYKLEKQNKRWSKLTFDANYQNHCITGTTEEDKSLCKQIHSCAAAL